MLEIFMTVTKLKEINDKKISYYFDTNTFDIEEKSAGIVTADLDFFDTLPDKINDYSGLVIKNVLDGMIVIERNSFEPQTFFDKNYDDTDWGAISGMVDIIRYYELEKVFPNETRTGNPKLMKRLMKEHDAINKMKERGCTQEQIDRILEILGIDFDEDKIVN